MIEEKDKDFSIYEVPLSLVDNKLDTVRRRRECKQCGKRFTTYERVELNLPMVVKSSGHRVPYDREKLRTGFMRALHKRPVPTEYVDGAIGRLEQRLLALGEPTPTWSAAGTPGKSWPGPGSR